MRRVRSEYTGMPSIETITTSHIVFPSRVTVRDRWAAPEPEQGSTEPPAIATAISAVKASSPEPEQPYRVSEATAFASLFKTEPTAPPAAKVDADAIEDEIAKILAMLEDDSLPPMTETVSHRGVTVSFQAAAASSPDDPQGAVDAAVASTIDPAPDVETVEEAHAETRAPVSAPAIAFGPSAPEGITVASVYDASMAEAPVAATIAAQVAASSIAFPAPIPPPKPASPIEVAARLASLIADHKSLIDEFSAAPARTDDDDPTPVIEEQPVDVAAVEIDASAAATPEPDAPSTDVSEPMAPIVDRPLPSWSSAAQASAHSRHNPAVESLVHAIRVAQSIMPPVPQPAPEPLRAVPEARRHREDASGAMEELTYHAALEADVTRPNPVPGFLGGVALSGVVGAALWAIL